MHHKISWSSQISDDSTCTIISVSPPNPFFWLKRPLSRVPSRWVLYDFSPLCVFKCLLSPVYKTLLSRVQLRWVLHDELAVLYDRPGLAAAADRASDWEAHQRLPSSMIYHKNPKRIQTSQENVKNGEMVIAIQFRCTSQLFFAISDKSFLCYALLEVRTAPPTISIFTHPIGWTEYYSCGAWLHIELLTKLKKRGDMYKEVVVGNF